MAERSRVAERLAPYRVLLASRMLAQMQYRASFVTDILGTVGVGLTEFAEVWVIFHNVDVLGGLSLAQRMRAELAAALLHTPDLLILDEPTIGLDVLSKQRLREFLAAERRERGTTLLLTTHDMGDIERLCDRVLVIDRGALAFDGTLAGLGATVGAQRLLVIDLAVPTPPLIAIEGATLIANESQRLRHSLAFDPQTTTAAAVLVRVSAVAEVRDLAIEEPDIEDVVRRIYAASRP